MITAEQAANALKEADATERRSFEAYSYSQSAPYCFVWGVVWLLGYGLEALAPEPYREWLGWWWMGLSLAGAIASIVIGQRQSACRPGKPWRMGLLIVILWLFNFALFSVLKPQNYLQVGAYYPLLFGAIYAAIGLWLGLRYILVGVFMAASALIAYFYLPEYFFHWMALVGGGSLVLTGFWMRKA
jgi:hypothetical protein